MRFITAIFVLFSVAAQAGNNDTPLFSLSCKSAKNALMDISVEAKTFINYISKQEKEMSMRDITVTVTDEDKKTKIGRSDYLSSDAKYRPTKYKNHQRFNLSALTETENFGKFYPSDSCRISLLIPETAGLKNQIFKAPTIINCDQSGGAQTLDCVATKIRD